MAATLESLIGHLDRQFGHSKVVVWEHNSHIGDARATAMSHRGEFNIGQLVRQRHGSESFLIGFSTYDGSVTAATDWGNQPERMRVNPALDESHEALLHGVGLPNYWIGTHGQRVHDVLSVPRLERAIGVVYRPHTERMSHYFQANMADQFDVVVHIDRTSALEPLERTEKWDRGEPPETYPSGL
jgi:erythromycin esterase-like protein